MRPRLLVVIVVVLATCSPSGETGSVPSTTSPAGTIEDGKPAVSARPIAYLSEPAEVDSALAFSAGAERLDLFLIGPDGEPVELASRAKDEFSPTWSPDGRFIAYRVNPVRSDVGDIWLVPVDGGGPARNLTRSPEVADWSPAWSPDGGRIAFFSTRRQTEDVWTMDSTGDVLTNLTHSTGLDEYPSWSPDGSAFAFNSHRDGQFEIYRANADGSGQVNLTDHPATDEWPSWSPDGELIAFMSERDGTQDIFVVRPDGSGPVNVTASVESEETRPAWTPDGRLSFLRYVEGDPGRALGPGPGDIRGTTRRPAARAGPDLRLGSPGSVGGLIGRGGEGMSSASGGIPAAFHQS